ncbi:MAG: UDP-N-acetylmuramate--L-alanine ligase [Saccharofermentanales bacterium]
MENETDTKSLFGLKAGDRIYFIGIGGYSMCGLAQICHQAGYIVAGSDKEASHRTAHLQELGIEVFRGHEGHNIEDFRPHCIVYTAAIPRDNQELSRARELAIPAYERSEFLGGIDRLFSKIINISGTHGKTTVTTICALILEASSLDPTAHIGAEVQAWGSTVRIGKTHSIFVSEACEYNSSFLQFASTTAAILNIDHDHIDCFPTIEDVIDVFARFACTVPPEGNLVIPSAGANVMRMLDQVRARKEALSEAMPAVVTFGREEDLFEGKKPDFYMTYYHLLDGYPTFDVYMYGKFYCHIDMVIPGEYNAMNALAAIACSVLNGASKKACVKVLSDFHGADNRFTDCGKYLGATVIADYAHHPSAIKVSFEAAKSITHGNVWTVFQPITYNRAIGLFDEFVKELSECNFSMIFEVYTSRETNDNGFSSKMICDSIIEAGGRSVFITSYEELKKELGARVAPDDIILIMGPEGMKQYAQRLVKE